jgi:hypothetical protein
MTEATRADWSWLADTYWYVRPADLPALQYDADGNTLTWLLDQTVWHLTGCRSNYIWGVTAALTRAAGEDPPRLGPGSRPVPMAMFGTITPEGRVHLTFVPDLPGRSSSATIGIGRAVPHDGGWSLEMQMSSNGRVAHWAYMLQTRPGDPSWDALPGVGLSVPDMLAGCTAPQSPGAPPTS